jgi:carboxymethylenebutenolidase
MSIRVALPALLLVANAVACSRTSSNTAPHATATASSAASPPPSATSEITSAVSEAEFKRMHELRRDPAAPRRGALIQLSTSRAYLSLPAAKPPIPAVVVIHEWWGLNEHVMNWADRLAADGYAALAVDLYGGKVATTPDEAMQMMKTVDPKAATAILLEADRFLGADPRVRASRRGVIGWCFGGGWALNLGLAASDLNAVVMYYGHVHPDAAELAKLHAPLLGIFANRDKSIPPDTVNAFDAALTQAKIEHSIYRYDADHAFANPSGPRYDERSAEDAWSKARAFLAAHLKDH